MQPASRARVQREHMHVRADRMRDVSPRTYTPAGRRVPPAQEHGHLHERRGDVSDQRQHQARRIRAVLDGAPHSATACPPKPARLTTTPPARPPNRPPLSSSSSRLLRIFLATLRRVTTTTSRFPPPPPPAHTTRRLVDCALLTLSSPPLTHSHCLASFSPQARVVLHVVHIWLLGGVGDRTLGSIHIFR